MKRTTLIKKVTKVINKIKDRTTREELEAIMLLLSDMALKEGEVVSGMPVWPKPLPTNATYPWSRLKVGDSFKTKTVSATMMPMASRQGQRLGMVFKCRSIIINNKHTGTIVTRVE